MFLYYFELILSLIKLIKSLWIYLVSDDTLYYCLENGKFYKLCVNLHENTNVLKISGSKLNLILVEDNVQKNPFNVSGDFRAQIRIPLSILLNNDFYKANSLSRIILNPNCILVLQPEYTTVYLEYPCKTIKILVIIYKKAYIESNSSIFNEV